ncbi:MAG TPA: VPLPA-CTERM sorting domain-containing protein [Crenotrichaceae bacterium]|nr:VPLPA-CTERM sorting domain-containing protein [Crenotrichaceae bacterium]
MNNIRVKICCMLFVACSVGVGTASASVVRFTDNGSNANLGHSFTEVVDGVTVTVSAFRFNGSNSSPSSAGAHNARMKAWGNNGIGIGTGGNPMHTADNVRHREFFLVEFDQLVDLKKASISEWGNRPRSTRGGDSDVDYWGGSGAFSFDNLGTRFEDDILSTVLSDGQKRNIVFDNGLGNVNWLLLGPEAFPGGGNVHDYIKLRNIELTAVPLPAAVWLMGSALLGLAGLKRKLA